MANPDHLSNLKEGVEEWNEWREGLYFDFDDVVPDLSEADLREADLRKADLSRVDLNAADLSGANLSDADLSGADLSRANLSGAFLWGANLWDAGLSLANLRKAVFIRANLNGANLTHADFRKADLRKADLRRADLSGANLNDADLSGADLSRANLSGVNFIKADLSFAKLIEANLGEANLSEANLSKAKLGGANLSGAILRNTILENAFMEGVTLSYLELNSTKGIDTVYHIGPSSLGMDTVKLSEGKLPEVFLRGCGLSPWEIEITRLYNPDLTPLEIDEILATKIFQKRTEGPLYIGGVFISYSHADSSFVDKLYKKLQSAGVSVWLDRHDMLAGDINKQVIRQIRLKDIVVLVLSKGSIESDWVEMELEEARKKEKDEKRHVIYPVAIDDSWKSTEGPLWRKLKRDKNILDFSAWKTKKFTGQFEKLIKGMQLNY